MKLKNLILALASTATLGVTAQNSDIATAGPVGDTARGIALYRAGEYRSALDQFGSASQQHLNEDVEFYSAMCLMHLGAPNAIDALERFAAKYPASQWQHDVAFNIANAYFFNGKYGEALTKYLTLDDKSFDSHTVADYRFRRAYCRMRLGEWEDARTDINLIANVKRYSIASTFYYGYLHYAKGDYNQALECFDNVKGIDLLENNAQYYKAQILFHQGKYNDVIALGEQLLEAQVASDFKPELLRIVGESYFVNNNHDSALTYLNNYITECDKAGLVPMRSARYRLGVIYFDKLDNDNAIAHLQHATDGDDATAQSAYLYLGICYVTKANHTAASMAFEKAMNMPHDEASRETAFFNYAVAQSAGSRTPFSRTINVLEEFINRFPNSHYATTAGEYLCNAYISGNDYSRALESINRISKPSAPILTAKQYVLYNLASSQYANGEIDTALSHINEAVKLGDRNNGVLAQLHLVAGNCYYSQGKHQSAGSSYNRFIKLASERTPNYALGWYSLGYAQFKLKKYSDARSAFKRCVSAGSLDQPHVADAQTRIGDTYYYSKNYAEAEKFYSNARTTSPSTSHYAMFQQAMMLGLQKKHGEKIALLDRLIATFPNSPVAPNAMLEKAQAHIASGNNDSATAALRDLIARFPSSPEARKGMLQLAITYKNMGNESKAIATYRNVIKSYPSSEEAVLAVEDLKIIYSDQGDIDQLQAFLASVPNAPRIDVSEMDKLTFYAAEKAYLENNAGTSKIEAYLKSFPNGAYALQARFYVAQHLFSQKKYDQALEQLNGLLSQGADASWAQDALAMKAQILMQQGHATDAMLTYQELAARATTADNRLAAQLGILRAANDLARYSEVIDAAGSILSLGNASADEEQEARFYRANALRNQDKGSKAVDDWAILAKDPQTLWGAKSAFYLAEYYFNSNSIKKAEKTLNAFIDEGTPHNYWLARAFILLSDIYASRGENFEAREYLESLKSNYPGNEPDIFEMIEQRLSQLNSK